MKMHWGTVLFFLALCFAFVFVRLLFLPQTISFGSDQARDFLAVHDLILQKHIPLIGPPSQYMVAGHQFFFGPLPYYLLAPALLLSNFSPVGVSVFLILLNALVLALFIKVSLLYLKDRIFIWAFAILYTFSPIIITTSRSYWNPYIMLPISLLLFTVLLPLLSIQKQKAYRFMLLGLLYGLGLQAHYSFILVISLVKVWLIFKRKMTLRHAGLVVVGFLVGIFPLLLFEMRNHFYNSKIFWQYFSSPHEPFVFQSYYLVSIFPLIIFTGAWFAAKLYRSSRIVGFGFLGFFLLYAGIQIFISPTHGEGMVQGWNYPGIQKVALIIKNDNAKNFNIADQLTLDNRATAVRYALLEEDVTPQGVSAYERLDTLYILSRDPLESLMRNPVYEIAASKTYTHTKTWQIQNGIVLYKLNKNSQ